MLPEPVRPSVTARVHPHGLGTPRCAICRSDNTRPLLRVGDFQIYRCETCSVRFSDALSRVALSTLYTEDYFHSRHVATGYSDYHRLSRALERTAEARLERLEGLVPDDRVLLDVGCGTGEFLSVASRRGWRCTGVEISAYAAEYGRRRHGVDIHAGALSAGLFPEHTFSAITLWDVVEHLPDPVATLAICARLLRPGGILTLSTGDIESLTAKICGRHWHLFNVPEHVFFFSRRTIGDVLRRAGFDTLSVRYPSSYYPAGYLLERLYKSSMRAERSVPEFGSPWLVRCNLFDIMEVAATPST